MENAKETKKLFTVIEAAEYLGVSRTKISLLIRSGELKAEKNPLDTRQKLISQDELERLRKYPSAKKLEGTESKN